MKESQMGIRNLLKKAFPKNTARGHFARRIAEPVIVLWIRTPIKIRRCLRNRGYDIRCHIYGKRVAPLLDPDALNKKIAVVQDMAASATAGKRYYVINLLKWYGTENVGLCGFIIPYFFSIAYALAIGRIPVIDLQNCPNIYLEKDKLGKENAWEYYFEQPFLHGLGSVQKKGKTKYCTKPILETALPRMPRMPGLPGIAGVMWGNEPNFDVYFQTWAAIYRQCFRLNEATQKYIDEEYNRLFKPGMRVLGVLHRGTDYNNPIMASAHPAQPDIDALVAKVKTAMAEWKCDFIFLATTEKRGFDVFNSHFPGRILRNKAVYYDGSDIDFTKHTLGNIKHERPNGAYLNGLEYLTTIVLLSRCTSAVLGLTAGSMVAWYINGGNYENIHVFDLGRYP